MSTIAAPRNKRAWARSQALRIEIRDMLASHNPLLPPLTACVIARRLTRRPLPSERCIRWHMAAIRLEAELAALSTDIGRHYGNS